METGFNAEDAVPNLSILKPAAGVVLAKVMVTDTGTHEALGFIPSTTKITVQKDLSPVEV